MIKIAKAVYDGIIAHAQKEKPIEACGYLGSQDGVIVKQYTMTNTDASPEHFSFDPKEQFAVLKEARSAGLKLSAVYHSHPATPARPSEEDIRIAFDPNVSYLIVSLAADTPVLKSFRIQNGKSENEEVEIE